MPIHGREPQGLSDPMPAEVQPFKVEFIKEQRVLVDQLIKASKSLIPSREVSLTFTQLQLTKSWLGKTLGEMDSPNPYPESSNPASSVIEPQADVAEALLLLEGNQVEKVKELRSLLSPIIADLKAKSPLAYSWMKVYIEKAILAAEEAKMWLGWELDRIRETQA